MANCDVLISQGIGRNCADPYIKGVERVGYAVNRSDIDFSAVEFRSDNELSNLPLVTGAKAFSVYQPGSKPFNGVTTTLEEGEITVVANHSLPVIILEDSPEISANFIDKLMNGGELVVVLENKAKKLTDTENPGGAAFKVYGYHQGMVLSEGTLDKYSDDTNGGWTLTLAENAAPVSAMFLNAGSYEATKTLLETLL